MRKHAPNESMPQNINGTSSGHFPGADSGHGQIAQTAWKPSVAEITPTSHVYDKLRIGKDQSNAISSSAVTLPLTEISVLFTEVEVSETETFFCSLVLPCFFFEFITWVQAFTEVTICGSILVEPVLSFITKSLASSPAPVMSYDHHGLNAIGLFNSLKWVHILCIRVKIHIEAGEKPILIRGYIIIHGLKYLESDTKYSLRMHIQGILIYHLHKLLSSRGSTSASLAYTCEP
ncbi:hypothetical protein H5410_056390 [Solanum commersonii]|uniref:Uncharacterized protein n=1 Tax=Solanum commersonii TaxID=4109 RepID=A0A9J5WMJ9_SOLCO|nr:hypothetical protein H5410_056390 [Solanum commersonii]